jgi:predicted RNA-binding Zn-ribbon protein involved in translation (DUF1610 family)
MADRIKKDLDLPEDTPTFMVTNAFKEKVTMVETDKNFIKEWIEFECQSCKNKIYPVIDEKYYPKFCDNCGVEIGEFKHKEDDEGWP